MKILYFASLKESLNLSEEMIEIDSPISLSKLRQMLSEKYGEYLFPKTLLCSINQIVVNNELQQINNNDEVAFFPAVTGG